MISYKTLEKMLAESRAENEALKNTIVELHKTELEMQVEIERLEEDDSH